MEMALRISFPSLERRGPATQEPGGGMSLLNSVLIDDILEIS